MNVQIKLKFLLDARAAYRGTGPNTISLSASIVRWLNHKGATVKKPQKKRYERHTHSHKKAEQSGKRHTDWVQHIQHLNSSGVLIWNSSPVRTLGVLLNQKRSARLHNHKDGFLMHWSGPIPKHTTGTVHHGDNKVSIMISSPCPLC